MNVFSFLFANNDKTRVFQVRSVFETKRNCELLQEKKINVVIIADGYSGKGFLLPLVHRG